MTKKIITSYTAFLCMAVVMMGATIVSASEVTGTLSSDTSNGAQTSGNIGGTVAGSGGGSGGGGTQTGGGSSSSASPSGAVLGDSNSAPTPGFPNAGMGSSENSTTSTLWTTLIAFIKNAIMR